MDKATIIGLVMAVIFIGGAMALGGSPLMYVDAASVVLVFGGTLAAALVKERASVVFSAFKVAMHAFRDQGHDVEVVLAKVVDLSKKARLNGLLALEKEEVPTDFMRKALRLITDGVNAEDLEAALDAERLSLLRRHKRGRDMFRFLASTAPAMGMIGTLVGLVAMLRKLDNPSAIGPAMAVALLTTLYGALIAFCVCGPIADKLASRTDEEALAMEVAVQGFVSIARGDRPQLVRERLEAYLHPKARKRSAAE